jgi:hypothetical protein
MNNSEASIDLENFEPSLINKQLGNKVPLSRQAAIRTFATEFIETDYLGDARKSLFVYDSVLATVCGQMALIRADQSKLAALSDMVVMVKDMFTVYLQQQNLFCELSPTKPLQLKDPVILLLCEYIMALAPEVKAAQPILSEVALWYMNQEESSPEGEDFTSLDEISELFDFFDFGLFPVAVDYLERLYPERLHAYLEIN